MKSVHLMLMSSMLLCFELRSTSASGDPCFRVGISCFTAPETCCDNLFCNNKTWLCEWINPPTTTPIYPTSTPWDCQRLDQECSYFEDCCSGLSCTEGTCRYDHPTTTPSGPCVQIGAQCFTNPEACCEGLHCNSDHQCEPDRPSTTTHPTTHRTRHTTHRTRHTTHRTPHTTHSHCQRINEYCDNYENCCSGLKCRGGTCQHDRPTPTPSGPCIQIGAQCYTNPEACCEGLHCNDNYECVSNTPSTTTRPTTHRTHPTTHRTHPTTHKHCQNIYQHCDPWYWSCCDGLICSEGRECQPNVTTEPPYQPCLRKGEQCSESSSCCSGSCDYYWTGQCY